MGFAPARAHDQAVRSLGEGWVGEEALAIALYSANQAARFGEAVRIGANYDGDGDSTASIAGPLWGAEYGLSGIPNAWMRRLDVFDAICDVAESLLQVDEYDIVRGSGRHRRWVAAWSRQKLVNHHPSPGHWLRCSLFPFSPRPFVHADETSSSPDVDATATALGEKRLS